MISHAVSDPEQKNGRDSVHPIWRELGTTNLMSSIGSWEIKTLRKEKERIKEKRIELKDDLKARDQ